MNELHDRLRELLIEARESGAVLVEHGPEHDERRAAVIKLVGWGMFEQRNLYGPEQPDTFALTGAGSEVAHHLSDSPRAIVLDLPRSYVREVFTAERASRLVGDLDFIGAERRLCAVLEAAKLEKHDTIVLDALTRINPADIALPPLERGNRHDRRVRASQKRRRR